MVKEISLAFIWHMHQPDYKCNKSGDYLMPWSRLHAVKDYLDMLLILEEFPKINQTFNLSPCLIDQLYDYGHNGAHDIHSRLTVKEVWDLTDEDKRFILKHFFDLNYPNLVYPHERYRELYERLFEKENPDINIFSNQEYADIMAWFNLAWFDPHWRQTRADLQGLFEKGRNFTLDDRKFIIEVQREIIRAILPKYKDMLEKNRIEITINPYYHPIIPLLINSDLAKAALPDADLPLRKIEFYDDAKVQIQKSIDRFKDIFGRLPEGIWLSEQCISRETVELCSDLNLKWTVIDESLLSETLGKSFVRNFYGEPEDPYEMTRTYLANINGKSLHILTRDSVIADLIGFEYCNHDGKISSKDLYERIKNIQEKIQNTPEANHILVVAMDGENCWENYKDDGKSFLRNLYDILSADESINVTTVKDFLNKTQSPEIIDTIHPGSWINKNFEMWIGDPVKNLAWEYIAKTRDDLIGFLANENYDDYVKTMAWKEIYTAEGSDWFWWFGEPNDSAQDDLFDELLRCRLQKVYHLLGKDYPSYLDIPVDNMLGKPAKTLDCCFTPVINGLIDSPDEWGCAGRIEIPQGPVFQPDKFLKRLYFGNDGNSLFLRFDVLSPEGHSSSNEIFIYLYSSDDLRPVSPMRLRNRSSSIFPVQKYLYSWEIQLSANKNNPYSPLLSTAIEGNMWKIRKDNNIKYAFNHIIEVAVPFSDINLQKGQEIGFVIATSKSEVIQTVIPQNKMLVLK